MRVLRIALIAAGVLAAMLVAGVAALLLLVDPNRYRGDIQRIALEKTGRRLEIGGKLELKIFPWLALSIHDVRLGNRAGYGAEPFLTVQSASIGVKLLPLLGKRVQVSRVAVDGLNVNLVTRGEENNWQDLGGSGSASAQEQPASSGSASIEGVDIRKSRLVLRDDLKKSSMELDDLELHTGRIATDTSRSEIDSVVFEGSWLNIPTKAQGSPANRPRPLAFSLRIPRLSVDTKAQTLAPAKIDAKLGSTSLAISVAGEQLSGDRVLTGTLSITRTSPRVLLQSLGIAAPVTRDSRALSAFALQTNFRLTPRQARLSDLAVTLDDSQIKGAAAIEDIETQALSFNLGVNAINVDRYRAPVPAAAPKKTAPAAPAEPPTPLPLETMRKLDLHGAVKVGSATFAGIVLTDLSTPLEAKDGRIHLGPTQAHIYGGTYNGDIVLDARPVQAQLSLSEHVRGTDIGALVKAAFDSTRLSGHADANAVLSGVGNTDDAIMHSLSGKIDANVKQGALVGIDVAYQLERANALIKRQIPPQHTGPERTVFSSLQTSATLDKGTLRTDDLRIETDFLKVHGGGNLILATQAIDYKLVASVTGSTQPGGGGRLDALKGVEVPLLITGSLTSPTVRPDMEALAKGQLRQQAQKKAGELLKGKLGEKLKDLLGH